MKEKPYSPYSPLLSSFVPAVGLKFSIGLRIPSNSL